ncbi:hypothetical protein L208DRAFT_1384421 [Tricholoma matsutake]|nr:hypothetical protein L208DRAFT_1384421 [Tricholoma matsutake 945]
MSKPPVVPAPPPTLNNLDPHQRTRLLRSTRKLEALLGITPYLLEPPSSTNRIYGSKTKSKENKQDRKSDKAAHSVPASHPLVLSLLSIPVSQSDARLSSGQTTSSLPSTSSSTYPSITSHKPPEPSSFHSHTLLSSSTIATDPGIQPIVPVSTPTTPGTPTHLYPPSPTVPSTHSDSSEREREREHDVRRKKIAKLTRTLGENVPPELVFHPGPARPEKYQGLQPDLYTKTPVSRSKSLQSSKSTTMSKSGHRSKFESQSICGPPSSLSPAFSKCRFKSSPASAPPTVIIGPPPTPSARRNRKSPSLRQGQNTLPEARVGTELVIPPQPSTPAPRPPSVLVEKDRLEKAKEILLQGRMASASTLSLKKTCAHRPRSLSLGSGIDLLGRYWDRELEKGDGKRLHGGCGRGLKVGEGGTIKEADFTAKSATRQWPTFVSMVFHPNPYQIELPSLPSPIKQPPTAQKMQRHIHSSSSPTFSSPYEASIPHQASASSSNLHLPLLRRKSSKCKGKAAWSTKVEVKKSNSLKNKNIGGVEVMMTVESDEQAAYCVAEKVRSGTPHPLDGSAPSDILLSPPVGGRRMGREWSGEWNRKDMDEVVKALRGLKAR